MLRRTILFVLLTAIAVPAFADHFEVLLKTKKGYFVVTTDDDGTPISRPIEEYFKHVIDLGDPTPGPGPEPGPGPGPGPGPSPVVPPDEFNNVGQLANKVMLALPSAAQAKAPSVAKIYRDAANGLEDGTYVNITAAQKVVAQQREVAYGEHKTEWTAAMNQIATVWNSFWPMDKTKSAAFYRAIANGFDPPRPQARDEAEDPSPSRVSVIDVLPSLENVELSLPQ